MRESDFAKAAMLSPVMVAKWYDAVERSIMEFAIASPLRAAMYIAAIGHESAGFVHTREIWGPTPAQLRYEGRADLGNTQPGDDGFVDAIDLQIPDYPPEVILAWNDFHREYAPVPTLK